MRGLGSALRCLGPYDDDCALFAAPRNEEPGSLDAWIGLGTTRPDQLEVDEAIRCFDRGLALPPVNAQSRWNRALACLTIGRLEEGWSEYRWGWNTPGFDSVENHCAAPRWDGGSPLAGRTVLVWQEQGIGRLAGRAIFECEPRLA